MFTFFTALVNPSLVDPYLKVECLMFSWLAGGWSCGRSKKCKSTLNDWTGQDTNEG